MKCKIFSALLCAMIFLSMAHAQGPPVQWQRSIGGTGGDFGRAVCTSLNGKNHYVGGYSNTANGDIDTIRGGMDIVLCRLDNAGNIIWAKTYGGTGMEFCYSVLPSTDGGVVVGGFSASADGDVGLNKGNYDLWIFKVDSLGSLLWSRVYGSSGNDGDHFVGLCRTSDGGYAVTTNAGANNGDVSGHHGAYDAWFLKLNSTGQIQWTKSIGGSANEDTHVVIEDAGGNFYIAGHTSSNDGDVSGLFGNEDAWVVKLSSAGTIIWSRCYGGSDDELIKSGYLKNNLLYFTGTTDSDDGQVIGIQGGDDLWVICIDTSGTLLWQKPLGGTQDDYGISITEDFDGMPLICGLTTSTDGDVTNNFGGADIWLVKLDDSGNLVWQHSYGGTQLDDGECIVYVPVEGSLLAGFTYSSDNDIDFNHGFADIWVARLGCAKPVAAFSPSDTTICGGTSLDFVNSTSHATSFQWSLNATPYSTAADTLIHFTSSGAHQIMLTATYGSCSDTAYTTVTVVDPAIAVMFPGDTSLCEGNGILFNNAGSSLGVNYWGMNGNYQAGASVYWVTLTQTGSNDISLVVDNGYCSDTVHHTVTVLPLPVVNLGNDTLLCNGCSLLLDAGNTGASFLWSTGDTTQTLTVSGNQTVWVLVDVNGCFSTDTIQVSEDIVIGFDDAGSEIRLQYWPNPFSGHINLRVGEISSYLVSIYSVDGRLLIEKPMTTSEQSIDTGSLQAGIYLMILRDQKVKLPVSAVLIEKY